MTSFIVLKSFSLTRNVIKNKIQRFSPAFSRSFGDAGSFKFSDLVINTHEEKISKVRDDNFVFGKTFSDHMLEIEWTAEKGWGKPIISPIHNLNLHPSAKVFHYAQELFEGMKAFKAMDGRVLLFRPDMNIARLLRTSERAALPKFDADEFLKCLKKLISIDKDWIPQKEGSALYIRPTFIGIEPSLGVSAANKALLYIITGPVGSYFKSGSEAVSLLADPAFVRAWPGGVGEMKMGCNYAATIKIQKYAESKGAHQVLWLFGENHELAEVGTMNIFVYLKNKRGAELVTPPLDGTILPGVVRHSLIELAKQWGEFEVSERKITMKEIIEANKDGRLLEIFGAGTACVVCPVKSILYKNELIHIPTEESKSPLYKRFLKSLTDIQYGRVSSKWSVIVE